MHWYPVELTDENSWRQNKRVEKGVVTAAQNAQGLTYFISCAVQRHGFEIP